MNPLFKKKKKENVIAFSQHGNPAITRPGFHKVQVKAGEADK